MQGAALCKDKVIFMELEQIMQLIDKLENSSLAELEICSGDQRVTLKKAQAVCMPPAAPVAVAPAPIAVAEPPAAVAAESKPAAGIVVKAPLVGTFYRASSPDAAPFVAVGDRVKKGQTVCLIEAMKMMNEIAAPADGVVEEILAENGEIVAFDAPLIRIAE